MGRRRPDRHGTQARHRPDALLAALRQLSATLRLALLAACAAAATWVFLCGSARAAESAWAVTELGLGAQETIFGMSCQASSSCVGVGQEGVVITSSDPTGGAGAWAVSHVTLAENLKGNLRGVSCPSASLCVAVDYSGGVYTTTEPAAGGGAWKATRIPKAKSLFGVSCISPSQCVLVGYEGEVLTSGNPTGGGAAWTATHLGEPLALHSVACAGGVLCVAGDTAGNLVTSTEPAGGAGAWALAAQPAGANPLLGASCAGASLCVAGNAGNVLVSTAPGTGAWPTTPLAARFQILAASCPTAALCVLSSNNGEVTASANPTGGSAAWATEHLIRGVTNALFGGQPAPPPPPPPNTRLGYRRRLIRLHGRQGATTVSFRFSASGVATFYRCQLDGRRSGLCRSPRRYRVGVGHHAFRARAFGPGGGDPTPATFRFRVSRARHKPPPHRPRGHV